MSSTNYDNQARPSGSTGRRAVAANSPAAEVAPVAPVALQHCRSLDYDRPLTLRQLLMLMLLLFLTFCVLTSCDRAAPDADLPRTPADKISGHGSVTGRVTFNGPVPNLPPVRNQPCCPGAPPLLPDPSFVIGEDGGLANAVVYVADGPRTDGSMLPAKTLDQKFCQYVPHVVGVVVGQTLRITTSDPVNHNVQYSPKYSPSANHWLKSAGDYVDAKFTAPEFIKAACDIHPWMNAQIAVLDNPLFAITDNNGNYNITNLPDGSYTLAVWHERYGRRSSPLTITADRPKIVSDFVYQPPK